MNKDRAKIFSSFNPLSTLEKALKAQEREKSEKLELDESKIEEILNKISKSSSRTNALKKARDPI